MVKKRNEAGARGLSPEGSAAEARRASAGERQKHGYDHRFPVEALVEEPAQCLPDVGPDLRRILPRLQARLLPRGEDGPPRVLPYSIGSAFGNQPPRHDIVAV